MMTDILRHTALEWPSLTVVDDVRVSRAPYGNTVTGGPGACWFSVNRTDEMPPSPSNALPFSSRGAAGPAPRFYTISQRRARDVLSGEFGVPAAGPLPPSVFSRSHPSN